MFQTKVICQHLKLFSPRSFRSIESSLTSHKQLRFNHTTNTFDINNSIRLAVVSVARRRKRNNKDAVEFVCVGLAEHEIGGTCSIKIHPSFQSPAQPKKREKKGNKGDKNEQQTDKKKHMND